ncbi:MAG: hypothetical protein AABX04_00030 [Nanoarchaeota archaeon]
MTPSTTLKIIGVFFAVVLLLNLLAVSFRIIGWGIFWAVLIVIAAISYWGIPWLKRKWLPQ